MEIFQTFLVAMLVSTISYAIENKTIEAKRGLIVVIIVYIIIVLSNLFG